MKHTRRPSTLLKRFLKFPTKHQEALRLVQRARAAIEAASLRASAVIFAARCLPPILPPLRPIWAMNCDTTDFVSSGNCGRSGLPSASRLTAMMPAWTSSAGLRERFRIHIQRGTSLLRRQACRNSKQPTTAIPHIWLLDPYQRTAFTADETAIREAPNGMLETDLVGPIDFKPLFAEPDEPTG